MNYLLLAYIFSIVNYSLYAIGRFMKNKSAILFFCVLSLLTAAISCFFFKSMSGFYLLLIEIFFNIAAYIKEKKQFNKIISYSVYIFTQILILLATYNSFKGISSIFCFISVAIAMFSAWWLDAQKIRLFGVLVCLFSFLYSMTIGNYIGVLELVIIAMNIVSYLVYKKKNNVIEAGISV